MPYNIAFDNGAQMVTLGSVAVKNPGLFKKWLEQYGNEKIILGADVKENKISVNGWKEESQQQLIPFLKDYTKEGVFKVLCTDISRDGMLQGPSVELYQQILKEFPNMHLIASGGVSCIQDIIDLEIAKVPAVVFGKALYEGKMEKRFDFVVKTGKMVYGIETNFYGSQGSKLNETARSYKTLALEANTIQGFTFVWFTDGKGWSKAKHNLEETFDVMQHIYSIQDMENGIMSEVFR